MKRLLILALALLCTGCTALPAEERAFAVALGIDKTDDGWHAFARIPTYQSGGGYTTLDAEGETLAAALSKLDNASPMHLHFDQLRLLIFSRDIAGTSAFPETLALLSDRHDLRSQSAAVITKTDLKSLFEAMEPTTGSRLSKAFDVLLETRIAQGVTPSCTLADILRADGRSSPILADIALEGRDIALSGGWPMSLTGVVTGERLSPEDMQLLALMQGKLRQTTLALSQGDVRVMDSDARASYAAEMSDLRLTLHCNASALSEDALRSALADACHSLLSRLAAANCDALGLGSQAIRTLPDIPAWHEFSWPDRYPSIPWTVHIGIQMPAS